METPYYLKKLKEDFSRKQRVNRSYSLRAYARHLKVHPATLSLVLLGKRPLPMKNTGTVLKALALSPRERTFFMDSLGRKHVSLDRIRIRAEDDRILLDEEAYYQVIAEWEHYAVLTLFDCEDFEPTSDEISRILGITRQRAEVVLENLVRSGLVAERKDVGSDTKALQKTHTRVRTTEDVASQALLASHRDTLELSKRKLDEVPVALRDFSSMMVALDPEKLPEAKVVIREFRQKLAELLRPGKKTAVYQLAIQFYPLIESPTSKDPISPIQTCSSIQIFNIQGEAK